MAYHVPVMLEPCLEGLSINESGVYVDLTFGGGGHSFAILARLGSDGKLVAFDQDSDAAQNAQAIQDPRFTFVKSNFRNLQTELNRLKIQSIDGILADLGVSSHQIDQPERGFSTRFEARLDMRMSKQQLLTAHEVVNTYAQDELASVLYRYGELTSSRKIAEVLVKNRPIQSTGELKNALATFAPKGKEFKFFAQVFQALRIEVNDELSALEAMLRQSLEVLKPKGRLVVMSYHSLEDRLVKNMMKTGNFEGEVKTDFYGNKIAPFKPLQSKVITPSEEELLSNPRARSAKLRIAEKLG
jgi:16S rRNA (cytosine1402-N4)-methyltransferase